MSRKMLMHQPIVQANKLLVSSTLKATRKFCCLLLCPLKSVIGLRKTEGAN